MPRSHYKRTSRFFLLVSLKYSFCFSSIFRYLDKLHVFLIRTIHELDDSVSQVLYVIDEHLAILGYTLLLKR